MSLEQVLIQAADARMVMTAEQADELRRLGAVTGDHSDLTKDEIVKVVTQFTSAAVCDFCTQQPVVVAYPAEDFIDWTGGGSAGGWSACEHCHDLIQADRFDKLAKRAARLFNEAHGANVPAGIFEQTYEQFRAHRAGPPVRIEPARAP